jgi:hypothetical protein
VQQLLIARSHEAKHEMAFFAHIFRGSSRPAPLFLPNFKTSGTMSGRMSVPKILFVLCVLITTLGATAKAAPSEDKVDLLLVLAADVSRSLDEPRFKLQRQGYGKAITNPKVVRAMTAGPNGSIALCFLEWAGANSQAVVIDWSVIASAKDAERLAEHMLSAPRSFFDRTSISAAIDFSMAHFARSSFKADRRVINISGDGTNNSGRDVTAARDAAVAQGVTINGIAILSEVPNPYFPDHTHPPGGLLAYYENNVIGGPGAFALAAQNFEAFEQALISKLIKEIAALPAHVR